MAEDGQLELTINGKAREFPHAMLLVELLVELGLPTETGIAVERNRLIVPKNEYAHTALESGDVLEIVTLVGGG